MLHRKWALSVVAAVVFGVAGCGSKVTAENYAKINSGMTRDEVTSILGSGQEKSGVSASIGNLGGSAKVIEWKSGEKCITVTFANDKVILKVSAGL